MFPLGDEGKAQSIPHIFNNNLNKITNTAKYNHYSMIKVFIFVSLQIALTSKVIKQYDW